MPLSRRTLFAGAVAGTLAASAVRSAPDDADVETAVDALTRAMLAPDRAALDALTMDGLSYGHSSGAVQDKAAFVEAIASGRSAFPSITLSDRSARVVGDEAIVRHVFSGETVSGGKTVPVRIGVLQVWHRDGGAWRLFARQAFKL